MDGSDAPFLVCYFPMYHVTSRDFQFVVSRGGVVVPRKVSTRGVQKFDIAPIGEQGLAGKRLGKLQEPGEYGIAEYKPNPESTR